jgi:hypothetical protein
MKLNQVCQLWVRCHLSLLATACAALLHMGFFRTPGLAGETISSPASQTILFVDDHHILYHAGTRRTLRPLDRYVDNPLLAQDKPWERTIAYCSVHRDPESGHYRLWYQAWAPPGCYLCYATSEDGVHWIKPNMGLIEFQGSKDNNLLMPIGFGAGVVVDPRDPNPARKYKFAYWDDGTINGHLVSGTCVAFSPDGIHWTPHPQRPLIRGSHGHYVQPPAPDDPSIITGRLGPPLSTSDVIDPMWDPVRQTFAIYAKTWLDGPDGRMHWKRGVVRTDSTDFIHWSKPRLVMAPDEHDRGVAEGFAGGGGSNGTQLHGGPVFYYAGIYFSMLQVLDPGDTGNMPIELAISRDGLAWKRPFRDAHFLSALEDKSQFDASIIWSNATPVLLDDEFRFYYGAYGNAWNSQDTQQISGLGLATLPRDRFAAIEPIETLGQITLKPLDLRAYRAITLNADASDGMVRVEVLDADGYQVAGFSKKQAVAIRGDRVTHRVSWRDKRLADLPEGLYKLRIHLENAKVYAVTLTAE